MDTTFGRKRRRDDDDGFSFSAVNEIPKKTPKRAPPAQNMLFFQSPTPNVPNTPFGDVYQPAAKRVRSSKTRQETTGYVTFDSPHSEIVFSEVDSIMAGFGEYLKLRANGGGAKKNQGVAANREGMDSEMGPLALSTHFIDPANYRKNQWIGRSMNHPEPAPSLLRQQTGFDYPVPKVTGILASIEEAEELHRRQQQPGNMTTITTQPKIMLSPGTQPRDPVPRPVQLPEKSYQNVPVLNQFQPRQTSSVQRPSPGFQRQNYAPQPTRAEVYPLVQKQMRVPGQATPVQHPSSGLQHNTPVPLPTRAEIYTLVQKQMQVPGQATSIQHPSPGLQHNTPVPQPTRAEIYALVQKHIQVPDQTASVQRPSPGLQHNTPVPQPTPVYQYSPSVRNQMQEPGQAASIQHPSPGLQHNTTVPRLTPVYQYSPIVQNQVQVPTPTASASVQHPLSGLQPSTPVPEPTTVYQYPDPVQNQNQIQVPEQPSSASVQHPSPGLNASTPILQPTPVYQHTTSVQDQIQIQMPDQTASVSVQHPSPSVQPPTPVPEPTSVYQYTTPVQDQPDQNASASVQDEDPSSSHGLEQQHNPDVEPATETEAALLALGVDVSDFAQLPPPEPEAAAFVENEAGLPSDALPEFNFDEFDMFNKNHAVTSLSDALPELNFDEFDMFNENQPYNPSDWGF
ncbi:hypothetical protein PV08_07614 [Exophiala spinifera]|uniref:Uncharacterized protein n=1 Tax=Exophiala spinifera TaxID=91928 RepID=A0A0D2BU74_9EURO|nr:uncharacterized protein PV08_07614 [Exophiala spinifera]KIW14829.1 hypothetical protein PV08_07614 [Exophiala spinifera]